MQPIVRCDSVSKRFQWHDRNLSLKKAFAMAFSQNGHEEEWEILSGISFEISPGERVGIVGRNGSGKTTLLRLIAGIFDPSAGSVEVLARRPLALLELGVGFYPDLSGRENIRLNWVFNGLSLDDLNRKESAIVEFSGVGRFLETPLKFYSSGMRARLGFSIVAHADPDLLLVDEVLAVGDAEFQAQCRLRMEELCSSGTTLLLVSHNPEDVLGMCQRAIWLDRGTIAFDGKADIALERYLKSS